MAAFKGVFSNRPFIGALLFVGCLYIFEEFLFNFPQALFFQFGMEYYSPGEVVFALAASIASFAICYLFVWAALGSSWMFQVLYVFLFVISSSVQYGYWRAVQRFIVSVDLRIAAATPIDTWKGASVLYFDWHAILSIVGFILVVFMFSERGGLKTSFIKFAVIFLLVVTFSFSYTFTRINLNLGLSLSSYYQTITRFLIENLYPAKREMVNYVPPGAPRNNIVLVIDESIRGDHLSINGYGRETTPMLDRLAQTEEGFYNFGLAISGATCSYPSNALILTGVRPGLDEFEGTGRYPTVFQYAKAAGYKTYYMDAQANSFWNGLTDRDIFFIDSWLKAGDFGNDLESDFRAADRIAGIVAEGSGNFIVLDKRGVHFLYRNNYPSEATVWLPLPADYVADSHLISNPYDNAILYNVNTFFERLLINPEILENTTILYTSDHGQTLFENGETWLHGKDTPGETIVPLILFGRNLPPVDDAYPVSHANILPALLDLMDVPVDQRLHPYAPSLFFGTESSTIDHFFFDGRLRLIDFPDP